MNLLPDNFVRSLLVMALLVAMFLALSAATPATAAGTTTFFLLTDDNRIATITDALPSQPATPVTITGLNAGDSLVAIDVRPQNGHLYGLGSNNGAGTVRLYHISPSTGVATAIGPIGTFVDGGGNPVLIQGARFGLDFNPAVDRLRVVTNSGFNFRINPNTGFFVDGDLGGVAGSVAGLNTDGPINGGGTTGVDETAYTNNVPNSTVTTQYTLDPTTDQLFIQNPPNSGTQTNGLAVTLNSIPVNFVSVGGFDIPSGINVATSNTPATGAAFAMLRVGSALGLYQIELSTGVATFLGTPGSLTVRGLAVQSSLPIGTALNAAGNNLLRFLLDTPGTVTTITVTGVAAGETLVGIDSRPSTGQLYGLGLNPTANIGTLYLLDPQTGAATIIGSVGQIAFVDAAGNPIDLPPSSAGYGVDFNPAVDRIRVVTGTGLSFRVNPITGAPVDGDLGGAAGSVTGINPDGPINGLPGGSTGVDGAAYTNNYAGTIVTTLYTLDATSNKLFIQNPPNAGTQTNGLALTLNGGPLDFVVVNGFDIPPSVSVITSNTPATGNAYAVSTVGGITGVYRINLATGAATALGALGTGATAVAGFVVWSESPYLTFIPYVVKQ